jgi:alcohol dehydrogenase
MSIPPFQYLTGLPRIFYGPDSLSRLGRELDRAKCRRVAVLCGTSVARDDSALDLVRAGIGDRLVGIYAGVRSHSPLPDVLAAAEELRRLSADAVVALGGGSAVVTARAAAILLAEGGDIGALCTSQDEHGELRSPKLTAAKLPQFVIPTTATTATVRAGSAVFDPSTGDRRALFDPKTRAQSVFIHPALMATAPPELVISAALDTLTQALEGLTSRSANPISDALLMHAVRLLAAQLATRAGHNPDVERGELMLAAILCGHGTDMTGAGMAAVLGHAIGGRYGLENGLVKAVVLPHVLSFNASAAAEGMQKILISLALMPESGVHPELLVNRRLDTLFARWAPARLRDLRVPREELTGIAERAMQDWFLRGNPRRVRNAGEVLQVLEAAW